MKKKVIFGLIGSAVGAIIGVKLFGKEKEENFTRIPYASYENDKYYHAYAEFPGKDGGPSLKITDKEVSDLVEKHLHPSDRGDVRKICEARELAFDFLCGAIDLNTEFGKDFDPNGEWYW